MHPLVRNGVWGESVTPPGKLQSALEVSFDGDGQYGRGPEGVDELMPGPGLSSSEALLREGKRIAVATCDPVQEAERRVGRIDEVIQASSRPDLQRGVHRGDSFTDRRRIGPGSLPERFAASPQPGGRPLRHQQPGLAYFVASGCGQALVDEPVHLDRIGTDPERSWEHR